MRASVPITTMALVSYQGCGEDINSTVYRRLDKKLGYHPAMTMEMCRDLAVAAAYSSFGMSGAYCAGTNDGARLRGNGWFDSSLCTTPCPGNAQQVCGGVNTATGSNVFSMFSISECWAWTSGYHAMPVGTMPCQWGGALISI